MMTWYRLMGLFKMAQGLREAVPAGRETMSFMDTACRLGRHSHVEGLGLALYPVLRYGFQS